VVGGVGRRRSVKSLFVLVLLAYSTFASAVPVCYSGSGLGISPHVERNETYMQAMRSILNSEANEVRIPLPEWARGHDVEVIILPMETGRDLGVESRTRNIVEEMLDHPLEVQGFSPMSRKAVHER